ncbi:Prepilin peptidase [Caldicellulosiruptor owensensis OL]|uniref:Prepilin peptidase n=1 Tax=Caldicellulosiruptor owensensis (strain ATCC 700167 / DSM 13100 / OL) TaxID=632518 RepID=E4Q3R4_CALOW|nr:A24 family peptidase [Caldicellulosiruptor owensensis]ADQ05144.1 Prepilin peptidase [Caldicellulosiruptor owensensis OL]
MLAVLIVLFFTLGSFLNVCIYRIPRGESIVFPPSHCPNCNKKLKWCDLIPVLSYIFLKGKCRYCGHKISIRYPIVETLTASGGFLCYLRYGISAQMFISFAIFCILLYISMVDIDTMEISTASILLLFIARCAQIFLEKGATFNTVLSIFLGMFFSMLLILIIYILSKGRAMGFGDVLLIAAGGAGFTAAQAILANFLAFIFGAVFAVLMMILKNKNMKSEVPFGPYIAVALFITMIYGDGILQLYFNYLRS